MADLERRVACPTCGREIRLLEAELLDKRGFCAACGARFDLLPEMLVGDGAYRALASVRAAMAEVPPSSTIHVDGDRVTIDSARPFPRKQAAMFGALAAFTTVMVLSAGAPRRLGELVPFAFFAGLAALAAIRPLRELRGRDRLTFAADRLIVERRGALLTRRDEVRYADLVGARIEKQADSGELMRMEPLVHEFQVVVVREGQEPLLVGRGLGQHAEAAGWLAARIERSRR